jgi:hypothetical protein
MDLVKDEDSESGTLGGSPEAAHLTILSQLQDQVSSHLFPGDLRELSLAQTEFFIFYVTPQHNLISSQFQSTYFQK